MLEKYADTAYRGMQDAKFRDEIATDERDSMYCRYQSKQAIYPREDLIGYCFDSSQKSYYKGNINGQTDYDRSILTKGKNKLTLALISNATNMIGLINFTWAMLHLFFVFFMFILPLFSLALGAYDLAFDFFIILSSCWGGSKLISLLIWPFFRFKFNLATIFNRKTGMVEIPTKDAKSFDTLPFEEFNAHYKVAHNPKSGFANRGFTLLHYKKNIRYEQTYSNQIACAFLHWELLQNFMDVTQPLADIPQFEYYREFDKTTAEFDKANGRPKYFWYRVDKSFLKEMSKADDELRKEFNDEEQLDNLLMGKPIKKLTSPDIFKFPWKYADNIKAECDIKFGKTLWQKFTSFLMVDL
ncbi:hypothetical protein [Pseudoalteromonas rhizosphaerae]|uniref:hypothetical protein n=1 Tax=Pseudoalteromonas rhizosphaerae TaxID=2518973 RepID=UPI0021481D6C|nr:hypothetical protein [Pseudoalteromonas rhizosphaerae]